MHMTTPTMRCVGRLCLRLWYLQDPDLSWSSVQENTRVEDSRHITNLKQVSFQKDCHPPILLGVCMCVQHFAVPMIKYG